MKTQHFIRMHLKTPSVDIAPVKLYPYVKSKTQTQMHELASCFCPYQLYPYDTLCTYGVKQLVVRAFPIRLPSAASSAAQPPAVGAENAVRFLFAPTVLQALILLSDFNLHTKSRTASGDRCFCDIGFLSVLQGQTIVFSPEPFVGFACIFNDGRCVSFLTGS